MFQPHPPLDLTFSGQQMRHKPDKTRPGRL
jgi:hypothetical protein